MTSVEAPPPSYDSVVSKAEQRIGNNVTPEKVLSVASNLSSTEAKVMTEKEIDPRTLMTQVDKDAFDKGVHDYLKTEAAKERLKVNADEATKACQLINTMFSNLSVKLGEIDSKNLGKLQFKDTFSKLHDVYHNPVASRMCTHVWIELYRNTTDQCQARSVYGRLRQK